MVKCKNYILLVVLLLATELYAQEMRTSYEIKIPFSGRFEFETGSQIKFIKNSPDYNKVLDTENSIRYTFNKSTDITIGYKTSFFQQDKESLNNSAEDDKMRLNLDVSFNLPVRHSPLHGKYRVRFQYSQYSDNQDEEKYYMRNRLSFKYKIHKTFQPYFSDEIYFDITNKSLKFNRIRVGLETRLNKIAGLDLYFINELKLKQECIRFQYIAGITLGIKIS